MTRFRDYDIFVKAAVKWLRLSRFPAKMTLVHARALLSIENNSSWSKKWRLTSTEDTGIFSDIDSQCNNVALDIYKVTIMFTFDFTCYNNVNIWLLAQVMCDDDVNFNIHTIYNNLTFKTIPLTLCFPFGGFAM